MTETNRLATETSPYLLQHANNPVHWWPWCDEALQQAKQQDKPILLSIGYSACHWCHVMAHESFEDEITANVMNEMYINIKVDREERPDLDKIYQLAHQLLTQRPGGWPLTMLLTPDDQTPFFAGTYFPVTPKHNMPAFREILQRAYDFYKQNRDDIKQQNHSLLDALNAIEQHNVAGSLDSAPVDQARRQLEQHYDRMNGGFGRAPKFPHPTNLERLLHHWSATRQNGNEDREALNMVTHTLNAMATGGMYDQLGGGFCRYSVDDEWMIPHFEKMLYDNGPLLALYSRAWIATGNEDYQRVVNETAQWVIREMQSPEGGYYSTLDADSEGEEGRFYVWTPGEVKTILCEEEYNLFSKIYGLDQTPNFEGHWHLHGFRKLADVAEELAIEESTAREYIDSARTKLFQHREQRVHPGRDEKILTSWNGLMIRGMALAARYLQNDDYLRSAQQAVDFINSHLIENDRLLATYKDGRARLMAYLDDYAFILDGLLELLQCHWRSSDLELAIKLADAMLTHFEDTDNGGFYFTAHDHEALMYRPKPFSDEAIPAGNAIAAFSLSRLGHLLGRDDYLAASERALQAAWPSIAEVPYAHCTFLHALEEYLYPPDIFVIRGKQENMKPWQRQLDDQYIARRMIVAIPDDENNLPGLLADRKATEDPVIAFHCSGTQCYPPITRLEDIPS